MRRRARSSHARLPARPAGSEVVLFDRYTEDREALCRRLADERGMTMIPPFDHPHVMAGQGTAALELIEDVGPLDALLVCVGGGGLIAGCAVAAKHLLPDIVVHGVEPEAGNDTQLSLQRGEIVHIDTPRTIADGAQTQSSGKLTFPVIQALVTSVLTVSDAQLVATMRFFAERMKMVVEPTGCLAAAALLEGAIDCAVHVSASSSAAATSTWRVMRRCCAALPERRNRRLRAVAFAHRFAPCSMLGADTGVELALRAFSSAMPSPNGSAKPSSMIDL